MTSGTPTPTHPRRLLRAAPFVIFGVLAGGILLAGLVLEGSTLEAARRRGGADLVSVAVLKVQSIDDWRAEALADVAASSSWEEMVEAAERATDLPEIREFEARRVLGELIRHRKLLWAGVVTAAGEVVVAEGTQGAPPDLDLVRRALEEDTASRLEAVFSERAPRLDLAAAIRASGAVPCVIYARIDATGPLARITAGWPVPSRTGEAVLARLEGDSAFFVTEPRFRPGWAFNTRVPISESDRGLVKAVVRGEGVFDGVDHLGAPLVLASRRVPDSELYMVTRMDLAEIEGPVIGPLRWVGLLVTVLLLAAGLGLAWAQREARLHLRDLALARQETEAGRKRLELALAGTHWVWEWDLHAGALVADPAWAASVGLPYHRLEGDPTTILTRITHPDDRPYVQERLEAHLRGRSERFEAEFRTRLPVGERWVRFRAGAVERRPDGSPLRLIGVLSDITDERGLQTQLERSERMASLGTLAAGVAHEINNPLTYVVSNLDVLEQGLADRPELAEAARQAREGTERVREVVRGLRSFSRGGTSRGPVNVGEELEAALRIARNVISHRATLDVDIGKLPPVDAHGRELGQVFLNLLVNAGQAIPEGSGRRGNVRVKAGTDGEGRVRIEIADDGIGIPPEVLPRIFEPFFTTKPLGVGTGLGLAIAHNVVTAAGGTIEVESQLGVGTTFRVVLPPARPRPARTPAPRPGPAVAGDGEISDEHELRPPRTPIRGTPVAAEPAPAAAAPPGRPAVLVVDDEPLVARSIARAIQNEASVTLAGSAEDARHRIEVGERYAAVVCDLMMPGMTGMDLHDWVSARDPALARRFVFVTGGAFTERSRAFLERTAAACVEKPFEPARLREVVRATTTRP